MGISFIHQFEKSFSVMNLCLNKILLSVMYVHNLDDEKIYMVSCGECCSIYFNTRYNKTFIGIFRAVHVPVGESMCSEGELFLAYYLVLLRL